MYAYRNPLEIPGAARAVAAEPDWPNEYPYPEFSTWRNQARNSIFRNVLALHLYDQGLHTAEVSTFLGLSESRTREIVSATALRLFGKQWANLPKVLAFSKRRRGQDSEDSVQASHFEKRHREARTEAILYALNHTRSSHKEWELFALAGALLARLNSDAPAPRRE